ncbi:solute carrier family 23 protein [Vibrio sinaloensis]|nr:solute carrier family 23 protein [Vibrio sinaloensis]
MLGGLVLATIVIMNLSRHTWVRLSSILVGLIIGWITAAIMGKSCSG